MNADNLVHSLKIYSEVQKMQIQFGGQNLCMFVHFVKKKFCMCRNFFKIQLTKENENQCSIVLVQTVLRFVQTRNAIIYPVYKILLDSKVLIIQILPIYRHLPIYSKSINKIRVDEEQRNKESIYYNVLTELCSPFAVYIEFNI